MLKSSHRFFHKIMILLMIRKKDLILRIKIKHIINSMLKIIMNKKKKMIIRLRRRYDEESIFITILFQIKLM